MTIYVGESVSALVRVIRTKLVIFYHLVFNDDLLLIIFMLHSMGESDCK